MLLGPRPHTEMATRAVLQAFERYQKERVAFVSAIAEMAKSPQVRCGRGQGGQVKPVVNTDMYSGGTQRRRQYTESILVHAQNIEALQQAGAMALLRPLLLDNVPRCASARHSAACCHAACRIAHAPRHAAAAQSCCTTHTACLRAHSIQQSAAMALGRLANYSDELAAAIVQNEILPQLVRAHACMRLHGAAHQARAIRSSQFAQRVPCACCQPLVWW